MHHSNPSSRAFIHMRWMGPWRLGQRLAHPCRVRRGARAPYSCLQGRGALSPTASPISHRASKNRLPLRRSSDAPVQMDCRWWLVRMAVRCDHDSAQLELASALLAQDVLVGRAVWHGPSCRLTKQALPTPYQGIGLRLRQEPPTRGRVKGHRQGYRQGQVPHQCLTTPRRPHQWAPCCLPAARLCRKCHRHPGWSRHHNGRLQGGSSHNDAAG